MLIIRLTVLYMKLLQPLVLGLKVLFQVLIFAEKKQDVDAIHEYLLLKGVKAVSIHGGKGNLVFLRSRRSFFK